MHPVLLRSLAAAAIGAVAAMPAASTLVGELCSAQSTARGFLACLGAIDAGKRDAVMPAPAADAPASWPTHGDDGGASFVDKLNIGASATYPPPAYGFAAVPAAGHGFAGYGTDDGIGRTASFTVGGSLLRPPTVTIAAPAATAPARLVTRSAEGSLPAPPAEPGPFSMILAGLGLALLLAHRRAR